jgi:hypothetical protein
MICCSEKLLSFIIRYFPKARTPVHCRLVLGGQNEAGLVSVLMAEHESELQIREWARGQIKASIKKVGRKPASVRLEDDASNLLKNPPVGRGRCRAG